MFGESEFINSEYTRLWNAFEEESNMSDVSILSNDSLPVTRKRRERKKDIELTDFSLDAGVPRISPFLCGTTIGAQVNRLLTDYSIAMLIVTGNHHQCGIMQDVGTGSYACYISTNKIHIHRTVSNKYKKNYEHWVVHAISHMIDQILSIPDPCVLFTATNTTANLWFDLTLSDGTTSKLTRIYLICEEKKHTIDKFELFLDTTEHDKGNW